MIDVALLVLALASAPNAQENGMARAITVTGNGRDEAPAGLTDLTFEIRGEDASSQAALKELGAKAAAVETAIRRIDPDLALTNNGVVIRQIKGMGCTENEDEDRLRLTQGACAVVGYRVSQRFKARTSRVLDAGTMAGLAVRSGAVNPDVSDFTLADQPAAKARAIAAAIRDAKAKAEAIASAGHFVLGRIVTVQLDGARNEDIVVTGSRTRSVASPEREEAVPVILKPEPVRTDAEVTVSFAILN